MKSIRWLLPILAAAFLVFAGCEGPAGPAGPPGPAGYGSGTALETCGVCHANGTLVDIDVSTGTHANAAQVAADRYNPTIVGITYNATGGTLTVEVDVADETPAAVTGLTGHDFRFTLTELVPGAAATVGFQSDDWTPYFTNSSGQATYQYGDSTNGAFAEPTPGTYTYTFANNADTAALDFSTEQGANGNLFRIAVQISNGVSNSWQNFTPTNLASTVQYPTNETDARQIVRTTTCNVCHDSDGDGDGLALHGGGRRDVEYCVTCHNPTSVDPDSGNTVDFKVMVHKIHFGKELPSVQAGTPYQIIGYGGSAHDYSKGGFPQPINNCTKCHTGGTESTNWYVVPSIEACGSCHDDVNFTTGTGHTGGIKTNAQCDSCHNSSATTLENPQLAHRWADMVTEAATWKYVINSATYDSGTGQLTVEFQVENPVATPVALTGTAWTQGSASRLYLNVGWKGSVATLEEGGQIVQEPKADYTNPGALQSAPGSALSVAIVNNGVLDTTNLTSVSNVYTKVITLPAEAQAAGTGIVFLEGHPAVNTTGITTPSALYDRIPVANALTQFAINDTSANVRRTVVPEDLSNCAPCHDTLSLHGQNRQGDIRVCTTCHNSANTDIARRPASGTLDGKAEEAIDMKYMIHRIHRGREALSGGITIYGFGGSSHVFGGEYPPGSELNQCTVCHNTNTYKPPLAIGMEGTTINSGSVGHADDLNISPTAAVCSGCHDSNVATGHMTLMGGSFSVLESEIVY